ncbi:hypothetical protein [Streptomyces griseoruber]|uniref:DUF3558 domain-containing protein n=1 Tax=Streptomyces griseoruber TaxID=1943 RepID=A0A101SL62_9ACTN|nr:hypothetical protein [Streptomyces griseoruber]KUN75758.1 hypothetical protein AQJ64_40745 [Streptomyces griseoruber]
MSEGTMQRRAQRDDQFAQRATRTGGLNRVLAAALAVPVMVFAAACSSDSGSDSGSAGGSASAADGAQGAGGSGDTAASSAPAVEAAAYATLPSACKVLSKKTLTDLVPKGTSSAKEGDSSDTGARASCSWSSLDNNGVKGSQFRWLNVSLLRFESDAATGDAESQAQTYYAKQVKTAQTVTDAKNAKTETVTGTGDQATVVRYDLKKKEGAFKQQTVVARVENVVITLDYNGAGLAGEKTPSADTLTASAKKAAQEVVAAVRSANGEGSGGGSAATTSPSPSASASKSASATPKPTATKSASAVSKATASRASSKASSKKS